MKAKSFNLLAAYFYPCYITYKLQNGINAQKADNSGIRNDKITQ